MATKFQNCSEPIKEKGSRGIASFFFNLARATAILKEDNIVNRWAAIHCRSRRQATTVTYPLIWLSCSISLGKETTWAQVPPHAKIEEEANKEELPVNKQH